MFYDFRLYTYIYICYKLKTRVINELNYSTRQWSRISRKLVLFDEKEETIETQRGQNIPNRTESVIQKRQLQKTSSARHQPLIVLRELVSIKNRHTITPTIKKDRW